MPPFHAFVYFDFLSNLLPVVFAMAIRYAQRNFSLEIAQKEVKAQKLQADLTQLKYQLQPHFFFNALNNIYSLIAFDPQKAQQSVHSLSKLMRHFMQNSDQKQISLAEEVDFLQQYISLMQLRLTDKTTVQVDFPKQLPPLTIAPLLFISLVENAFKHGVSATEATELSFSLRVEENKVIFRSENSIIPKQESLYSSGIGIENLKKRLTLLYPKEHQYIVEEKVIYDSLGILEIYAGASEGFVVYSRDNDFGKSVIKEEGYSNKVLIDKKQDCLIDGKDTIRNFEVFLKDRLIMVYPKEDDRIYVYKFK